MRYLICLLLAANCCFSSEFEYIFWGKINTQNLALSKEEFHLSRAMQSAKTADKYEFLCTFAPANLPASTNTAQPLAPSKFSDSELFFTMRANKAQLLECAKDILVRHFLRSQELSASEKTNLSVLPFRFLAELGIDKSITIYARKIQ